MTADGAKKFDLDEYMSTPRIERRVGFDACPHVVLDRWDGIYKECHSCFRERILKKTTEGK